MFWGWQLQAQAPDAVAAFDSQYVETGNPFVLHLAVPDMYGQPIKADFSPWDSVLPQRNFLYRSSWQHFGGQWTQSLHLITFDSARLELPPLPINLQSGEIVYTNALQLNVVPTPAPSDPSEMEDIKGIHREQSDWRDYIKPVLPIVLGALLLALVIWWVGRRKRKSGLKAVRDISHPPHVQALRRLQELAGRNYLQNGRVKDYYSELSHIAREYLERRYGIPVLELASEEILSKIKDTAFPAERLPALTELLRWSDLAKFAKGVPPESFHARAEEELRQLIRQTIPPPPPPVDGTQMTFKK